MAEELATATYSVFEPFEQAVRSLREALVDQDVKLVGELDVSGRIRQRLLIGTAPCRILLVTAAPATIGKSAADNSAAMAAPLHIVVSACGSRTEIHFLRIQRGRNALLAQPAAVALRRLQARIAQAVERIGMRSGFVV